MTGESGKPFLKTDHESCKRCHNYPTQKLQNEYNTIVCADRCLCGRTSHAKNQPEGTRHKFHGEAEGD